MLTLGVDGSLLLKNQAAAAAAAAAASADASAASAEAERDPVVQPPVTLVAADALKTNRAFEKRRMVGGKAVEMDFFGGLSGLKVPGGAGCDAGGRTVLTVTDVGDVVSGIGGRSGGRKRLSDVAVGCDRFEWVCFLSARSSRSIAPPRSASCPVRNLTNVLV